MLRRAAVASFLVLLSALVPLSLQAQQTCGGTERWQVKVGTDSDVGSVQLQPVIQTTVEAALRLQPPDQLPPSSDNDTRLPEEMHVYQLSGHLVEFKQEAGSKGDSDYHLVITDDTLQFTNDAQHDGPGHSVIAEIPDPNCIAGKHGDPDVASRFISQITCARAKMDVKFPDADRTGQFNDTGDTPVTITGVGFFDRAHGQTGRAANDLEIHPILDIDFGDGQPSCFPAASAEAAAHPAVLAPPPPPLPPPTSAAPPGAKWEYKSIAAPTAKELLAQATTLGAQGWELVGVAFDPRKNSYVGFLKRAARP
jgi:hypothetical protein